MIITIFVLIVICGVLVYQLSQKKQVDEEIRQQNEELNKTKQKLELSVIHLKADKDALTADCQTLKNTIDNEYNYINKIKQQNETIANEAYSNYVTNLEEAYTDIENKFDKQVNKLYSEIDEVTSELDKLKLTRAAAHKALLKEQEIKENKDNYRLIVPEIEKRDIKLLNSIKKELINERPVNMVIWQTYYSKKANDLCARILGTKNIIGIYKITEISTGRCYIGQSKNVKDRLREHMKCGLGIDTPNGNKLYQAMLDSSIEDFTFELIEECCAKDLDEKERYFISLYQSYDYGFNSNRGNSNGRA